MKKLMMMAAVACAASLASAAQIAWSPAVGAYSIDNGSVADSAIILIVCDKNAAAPSITWNNGAMEVVGGTLAGKAQLSGGALMTQQKSTLTDNWDASGATYTVINGTGDVAADYNYHDYYEVIFDSATISADSKWQIANTMANKRAGKNTGTLSLAFSGKALSAENWNNIPEPCTVALLALGMGALALRRKQR